MLQVPRRDHPLAIQRSSYKKRGPTYTDLGVAIRCGRQNGDQSSVTNTLHYLTTGGATLKFVVRKQEFLIPVILIIRALAGPQSSRGADEAIGSAIEITDEEIYRRVVQGNESNTFLRTRAQLLLQDASVRFSKLNTPDECLEFIGSRFRRLSQRAESTSDVDIGRYIINKYILIHCSSYRDKLECLLLVMRKLYAFAAGDCGVDNADSLQNQELLMPGHLLSTMVKEKFEEVLQTIRLGMTIEMRKDFKVFPRRINESGFWSKLMDRYSSNASGGIGKRIATFLWGWGWGILLFSSHFLITQLHL